MDKIRPDAISITDDNISTKDLCRDENIQISGRFFSLTVKRLLDIFVSFFLITLVAPVILLIAVVVMIDSPGPVLFRQRRYGLDRSIICITKFRTMRQEATDHSGRVQAIRGDTRVTRVGRFLRATCLDELPQLWDVLMGRMSLVGPRPHPVDMEVEQRPIECAVREYHKRHRVRPGITGLAQIRGNRGPVTSIAMGQERIDHDNEYIDNWSILTDLRILASTVIVPFKTGHCY
jgi:lipopolysaccharide/colanic/teichoic acid biosynthesis glycosyltransferase